MNQWERGFQAGERTAFMDRKHGRHRKIQPETPDAGYGAGWWAGYTPRNPAWALRPVTASRAWWQDRDEGSVKPWT